MNNCDFPWFFVCLPGRVDPTAKQHILRNFGPWVKEVRSLAPKRWNKYIHFHIVIHIYIYIYMDKMEKMENICFFFWGGGGVLYIYIYIILYPHILVISRLYAHHDISWKPNWSFEIPFSPYCKTTINSQWITNMCHQTMLDHNCIYLCIYRSIYLSIDRSIYLSVYLSVCLSVCLSI